MEPVVEGVTFYVKYLGSSVVVILMILEINLKDETIIYNTEGRFPKKRLLFGFCTEMSDGVRVGGMFISCHQDLFIY